MLLDRREDIWLAHTEYQKKWDRCLIIITGNHVKSVPSWFQDGIESMHMTNERAMSYFYKNLPVIHGEMDDILKAMLIEQDYPNLSMRAVRSWCSNARTEVIDTGQLSELEEKRIDIKSASEKRWKRSSTRPWSISFKGTEHPDGWDTGWIFIRMRKHKEQNCLSGALADKGIQTVMPYLNLSGFPLNLTRDVWKETPWTEALLTLKNRRKAEGPGL